jgi:hypothetical protein
VVAYNKEVTDVGVADGRMSPMLIPMYTDERVRGRQLTAHDVRNVRLRPPPMGTNWAGLRPRCCLAGQRLRGGKR